MEVALLGACLCACGGTYALWRRGGGGGEVWRRTRRTIVIAVLFSTAIIFYVTLHTLVPSYYSSPAELEQFVQSALNCSVETGLRAGLHVRMGVATRHQWYHAVGYSLDDLRLHWAFPQHPNTEDTTTSLRREFNQKAQKAVGGKYAHRVFGYLLPSLTGVYFFHVSFSETSASASVEFWLSPTSSPMRSVLLGYTAVTSKEKYNSAVSKGAFLQSCGVYYFEFLEQAYNGRSVAEVMWKVPGSQTFSPVPSSALASVEANSEQFTSTLLPSMVLQRYQKQSFVADTVLSASELTVLPECKYHSKTGYAHTLKEYWGHKEVLWSHIYPRSNSGTKPVPPAFAANVLEMYKTSFNKSSHRGVVHRIRYMDTTENLRNRYLDQSDNHRSAGTRMLLEMDVTLEGEGDVIHTSEYVYLPKGGHTLCHTSNFQWQKNVDVHIVVSVKNLGLWVQHLIHNMEHLYEVTRDEHFELIIVDYQSADLNVEAELKASSLPRWKVISLSGDFSRSGGLQAGIDYVSDPNSIVMTIDMHLTLPPGFVEYTRRHVVQGKMGFAPMFFRLNEGRTEASIAGFWETLTYGLLGMYKSDWVRTRGFDTQKYTTKWGGEDWDAVDRVRSQGLELFRLGYPGLVHYFHSKTGMWNHQ